MVKKDNSKAIEEISVEIEFLCEDRALPKNMRNLVMTISERLENNCTSLEISNIMYELEDITNNSNVPQFCRSAVWSLISKLEILKESLK